jgi:Ca2+-binding RTX toxin-like protein
LSGRNGDDELFGLNGRDSLYGGNGSDVLRGGAGNDRLFGQADNDRLLGNSGSDYLRGGAGDDVLFGLNGRDSLYGGNGSDVLRGGAGNDRLFGQAGNDRLLGNSGSDYLRGGVGSDTFIFRQVTDSSPMISQRDVIGDFTRGVDKISFAPIDGHTGRAGNQAFEFIGLAGFDGDDRQGDVRIHHLTQGGVMVAVDQDGDGHRDFIIEVRGVATLSANDFIL